MSIRLKRLYADYQLLSKLFAGSPFINIDEYSGNPPERYIIEYRIKSLVENDKDVVVKDMHLVEVVLPKGYPREPPFCRMLSPIFHPNISPQNICIGDHWAAGESLSHLLIRIAEMMAFQSYNLKSPLNGEAARWADLNMQKLPVDATDYYAYYADKESEILSQMLKLPEKIVTPEAVSQVRSPSQGAPPARVAPLSRSVPSSPVAPSPPVAPQSPGVPTSQPGRAPLKSTPVNQEEPGDFQRSKPQGILKPNIRLSVCAQCGKPAAQGHVYCNDCYTKRELYDQHRQEPFRSDGADRKMVSPAGAAPGVKVICDNCRGEISANSVITCTGGHRVCADCSLRCLKCGRYYCALCSKDKYTFIHNGIICFTC